MTHLCTFLKPVHIEAEEEWCGVCKGPCPQGTKVSIRKESKPCCNAGPDAMGQAPKSAASSQQDKEEGSQKKKGHLPREGSLGTTSTYMHQTKEGPLCHK
jgi:hypothetical protein